MENLVTLRMIRRHLDKSRNSYYKSLSLGQILSEKIQIEISLEKYKLTKTYIENAKYRVKNLFNLGYIHFCSPGNCILCECCLVDCRGCVLYRYMRQECFSLGYRKLFEGLRDKNPNLFLKGCDQLIEAFEKCLQIINSKTS